MKKFMVIFAVLALTMVSSVAMAEVTFDGSIEFLMRSLKNTSDWNDDTKTAGDYQLTYERLRFGVNAKHDNVKGRIQFENDWDTWGDGASTTNPNPGFETPPSNRFYTREAWLDFTIPGAGPAHVKVGRQFLQLGNGWYFRSNKYGSDAWLVGLPGKNTVAFVNVKASENIGSNADDTDAYVLLDVYKLNDNHTVGAYISHITDRQGKWYNNFVQSLGGPNPGSNGVTLDTLGVHYTGKLGPLNLMAELDYQMGEVEFPVGPKIDLSGKQLIVQANMPIDALTISATAAMGSGDDPNTTDENEEFIPFLDKDPHYTLVYEYYMNTAAGRKNTGFANTTALGLGAKFKISKMFTLGADLWWLTADQKFNNSTGVDSDEIGQEVDIRLDMNLYDQLSWIVVYGHFIPGGGYENAAGEADNATAWHSVLSYKF